MAASKKKSLPLRHLTDTFTNQREQMLKNSHLQERWQELKERELNAQQNNRQLLQQFDEAQDTLREMITLTADMTTIRMEYERYLEESYPRWQQQLERKTQSAQRQGCSLDTHRLLSIFVPGPTSMSQQMAAPPNHYSQNLHMDYNQHGSPHLPYIQTSWQPPTQFQRARFPIRAQHQPQGYSHVPPSFPQHPDPYHHQHLDSPPGYHHSRQDAPGWAPLQPEPPWPLAAGAAGISACSEALWGPLYREEPPPEIKVAEEEVDTSLAPSSKREGGSGGRSSHFSQELDIKPVNVLIPLRYSFSLCVDVLRLVRLSGGPAESSESSRESSQGSREKTKRGTSQKASLDSCSSHESSESSSAIVIAAATAATAAQNSESDASSEKSRSSTSRRKRRGGGLAVGSPSAEKPGEGSKGENSGSHREESRSTSAELGSLIEEARIEKGGNQRHGDHSESCGEESGSHREEESGNVSVKIENRGGDEIEKQESNSSEQSSVEGKEEEEPGSGDGEEKDGAEEKENNQTDEEQEERDVEDDDDENVASEKIILQIKRRQDRKKRRRMRKRRRVILRKKNEDEDEDDNEGEENTEDEESDEDEQRGDEAGEPEEERDSDDSIISPQQNRSKKMNVIPEENSEEDEEEEEEEEGIKTGSSEDEISDDDVENLLAPQDQSEKEEKDLKAAEKPKAICDNVEIFQVEPERSTESDHPSDSDEFDQFYE
ncbi:hypothetical protein F7725_010276 [Dissostichus mawsoni]|uniref:Uncharacterized protein n=1 Tax=Dissostichus mawsoni TaxID=36200 RepID=A0A7J5XR23_DISMA|nr:hypothetical protein F7725_010276 [Dissostichus mawsoni]